MIIIFIFKWILKVPSPFGIRSIASQEDEGDFLEKTSPARRGNSLCSDSIMIYGRTLIYVPFISGESDPESTALITRICRKLPFHSGT
jgi:hypothetical protein